ncbi:MAG: SAM-dependent chlorinase/fluorinase [Deltaproteobacteria bacterium]|nr:SAM-dependent chlorinase/fluorinase [Deltaproteobacteria bacterium]
MTLITLSSDFGSGNIGCGAMEAAIHEIAPKAKVIHLCHSIPAFDIQEGARMLEGTAHLEKGIHVGVVDPGVGTSRRGIVIETKRGDFLIGPDNGLLRPAAEFLGGIKKVFELSNDQYQRNPVSPVFHGRDIFAPAAAYLAKGVDPKKFGASVDPKTLVPAPYPEAYWVGDELKCKVIHINEKGSLFLNVRAEEFKKGVKLGDPIEISLGKKPTIYYELTFGEVPEGRPLILDDDFGRVQLSVNRGNFAFTFKVKRGESLTLRRVHE